MTRRPLGPGPALREALAARTPAPRRPPWLPEDPATTAARQRSALLDAALPGLDAREERVTELDADELQETAALADLTGWEDDLARLAAALVAVDPGIPLDLTTAARGRALDGRLQQAHGVLLATIAEYHHGGAGPGG